MHGEVAVGVWKLGFSRPERVGEEEGIVWLALGMDGKTKLDGCWLTNTETRHVRF